jgi:hypothetical protein
MRGSALIAGCVAIWLGWRAPRVAAQTLQGDRIGDVTLGRFRHVEGGLTFGARHDHSFAAIDPGLRRDEYYITGTIRVPMRITDLTLGTYLATQNVGRFAHFGDDGDGFRNVLWGHGEASIFGFVALPIGQFGLRIGWVPNLIHDNDGDTWRTAIHAARTRPIDVIQLLPQTRGARSSMHYRVDYGVIFAQVDLGYDRRWSTAHDRTHRQNTDGGVFHFSFQCGLGTARWGVTYGFAHVWVATRVFPRAQDARDWSTEVTASGEHHRAAAHSLAYHWYGRHWSPYAGLTFVPLHGDNTALSFGIDYAI